MWRKISLWGVMVLPSGFDGGLNGFAECLGSLGRRHDLRLKAMSLLSA